MVKCERCNEDMIEKVSISIQHPFELGADGRSDRSVSFVNGTKQVKTILGNVKERNRYFYADVKARICPKCNKVEFYIDINNEND